MVGLDRIPKDGPAILVLYHPPSPVDAFFIISTIFLHKKRKVIAIVERMNFKFPGKIKSFFCWVIFFYINK